MPVIFKVFSIFAFSHNLILKQTFYLAHPLVNSNLLTAIDEEPMLPIDPVTLEAIPPDLTPNGLTQRIEQQARHPNREFCIYECRNCKVKPKFQLKNFFETVKQNNLLPELKLHGHKTCLRMPNGILRNTEQGKQELYNHYITYHREFFGLD